MVNCRCGPSEHSRPDPRQLAWGMKTEGGPDPRLRPTIDNLAACATRIKPELRATHRDKDWPCAMRRVTCKHDDVPGCHIRNQGHDALSRSLSLPKTTTYDMHHWTYSGWRSAPPRSTKHIVDVAWAQRPRAWEKDATKAGYETRIDNNEAAKLDPGPGRFEPLLGDNNDPVMKKRKFALGAIGRVLLAARE